MSRHSFDTIHANERTSITMGWDKIVRGFFMVIEKSSDNDDPFWSNLTHHLPPFPNTLDSFLKVIDNLNIHIPQQMIEELLEDQKNNVGNKHVAHYLEEGEYFRQE